MLFASSLTCAPVSARFGGNTKCRRQDVSELRHSNFARGAVDRIPSAMAGGCADSEANGPAGRGLNPAFAILSCRTRVLSAGESKGALAAAGEAVCSGVFLLCIHGLGAHPDRHGFCHLGPCL